MMQELLPERDPAGSRERRLDQRKEVGAATHEAHRASEQGRDGLELSEAITLGGDSREELRRWGSDRKSCFGASSVY